MTTAELYTKGAQVWVPHPELVWQGAELTKDYKPGDKEMHLETEEEKEAIVKKMKSDEDLPPLRNPDILVGQNDLTSLSYLHEPAVLYNLQVRFLQNNAIYTYCGIVLVAINPYEQLPLYGNEMVMAYTGQDMGQMDPHIYAVAEEAFRQMQRDERNQSIIVSGESGAGKTVSAKYAMRYFATVGGSSDDMEASIEQRVLASNPIMEAIGNAKTIRNDNSSRFGKYIQIGFNKNYTIIGANMRTYLLEKSRIVFQAENERTYHIFYQLCAAADLPEFEDFCLSDPMNFNYTNQGGDPIIKDLDDLEEFHNTKQAMSLLGFSDKIQQEIFRILAALLHLGNIEVDENFKDSEKCFIDPENPHLYAVAELLGVDMNQFRKWMCNRKITAVHQVIEKPLRSSEAMHGRDALAKFLYGQLFDWIVSKINTVLTPQAKESSFIGVLDIYGFEVFEVNSFEQFCINYANEKLQQQFTQHVFKLEQEEYVREEITWSFIDFYDNQPCIDLIEAKLGLLDLLDEECKLPKGSDQNWCQKLYDKHLKKAKHFDKPRMSNSAFIIFHFADKVEYQAEGFLGKNRDLVNEEHINILRASEFQLVADLVSTKGGLPAGPPAKKGKITMKHLPQKHKQPSKEMRKTVGLQFKESLCLLMETLNSTTPHYVRCIKPNDEKMPFTFEPKRAMQQLRACGVLETIRISSAGYPSRWTYPEFFQRYRVLMVSTEINREDTKNTCATVVSRLIKDPDKYQFGKSKIFFRAGQVAYMEKLRSDKLRACSIMIQKHIRGWLMKRRYQKLKQLALWLQQRTRGILARRYLKWMRQTKAATTIQKRFRGYLARSRYQKMRWTILRVQAWARGKFARIRFLQLRFEVKARLIQRAWRGYVARKRYWHEMQSIILIQSCWRRWLAKKELKKLKIQAKSVDHYKTLNKGMENKIIDLQRKLNEQNKESKELHKKVEVIQDLQTQVTELKKTEEVAKVSSNKVHELEDEITKLKAELDLTKKEKQMLEEEGEIFKEEQEMLNSALKAEIDRLATENKELMEKVALQEEEFQAAHVPELELEKMELEGELAQERSQHQQLIKDYARLEQRYENMRDEMTLLQQGKLGDADSAVPSPRMHRRAGSDVSSVDLNSESGYGTIGKGEGEEQDSPKAPPRVKSLKKHAQELEGENQRLKVMVESLDEEKARMETMLEAETGSDVGILVGLQKKVEALRRENEKLSALAEGKELPKDKDEENQAEVMARLQKRLEEVESERKKLEDVLEEKEKEVKEQQADLVDGGPEVKREFAILQRMIEVLEGDNEALLDDLKSKEKIAYENEALKKNINTLEDDNKNLLENIKAKEKSLLEKEEALDQYLEDGGRMEYELEDFQKSLGEMRTIFQEEAVEKSKQLIAKQETIDRYVAREAEREETIRLLQEQLALLTGKIEIMQGYLQDMEFEFKETTNKLEEEKRAAVNQLEAQMEDLALEKDTLDAVMEKKEREAEEMRQKMAEEKDSVVTEMQEELENILAEKQKLKMKIEDKEQEMAETAQKIEEEKEEELAKVQEHLEAVKTEKENIRREMAKKDIVMKEKLWKLEEEKKALVAEYQDELERLTDDADVLDALLEKKNQEMLDVENKLKTEKSSAVSELQEELEAIQFQREKLRAALDEKEVKMAQTAIKLQEEKDRDLKKVVAELEKEKEKFEAAVGEKESEIVKTKEELRAEKEAALSEMQRQMNEIIGEKEKLSTSLSEKEKEIVESVQKLKAEQEETQEREAKLLSEISTLRKQVQDMEVKYREDMELKEHEVKTKEETIDSHKAQAVTQESTVHVLMHQIKTLTKRIASMEDKIDDMEFEFQEKTEQLEDEKQSVVTELETQLKDLTGQKDSMESLLKSKEREITEAQEKIKTENVGMVAKLQERLESMLAEKIALSQTIKKKDADMAETVRKIEDEKEQAINEVKEQLKRAREEQDGLKNVLGKKEAELSERVRKMEEEKRSLISQFQDQLDQLSDEKDILDALLEKKEQEMVETKQKVEEEKSGTVSKLKQELNDISAEKEMLKAAIHEKEQSMAETSQKLGIQKESAVAEVKEQLDAVKKEREKWKKALEKKERDMTNRITRLEEERDNLATKYEKEVEKLIDDRDMLEAQMEKKDAEMVETQRNLQEEKSQAVRRVSQDLKIIISERMKLKIAIQEKEQMMADASDKLKDEKEKEVSGLQTELHQTAEEKEKLLVALERKNSEVSKTKKQLKIEKQAAIHTLKRQLSGIIKEKQELQKVIVQKEQEITQSMKKIQTEDQAVINELQRKVDEITGVKDKLEAEKEKEVSNAVQALEDAISHMDTEEEKEKKRLHLLNLQNHVTKLEQENKDLQEALDVAKMKRFDVANLPEEMTDLVEENKKLKNDITNLRQAVADSNTEEELVKQLDVLTEELMVRRDEVLTLKTSMVDQNIENSDQWDKETMTDLDLYLYPPEYLESLNEDGELMQAYLTQKETNRLLEAQMQASKKNSEFQEQELRNEIAALKEENIRQQKLLGQNLQLTPEARIEANLQHEITRLTADNLDLREEVENHEKQQRRLKKQIKILMKRQNMQGGDQSALTPDAGSEPSPKDDEGGPHVKTKDDRVFMGMLEYRKEDEQKLIKNLIIDLKPKSAVNMLPGLPAYILFMCIRHADYIGDDNKVKSLLTGTINGIKRVLKKRNEDFETVSFWLANTCRLLHNLKQYSGEDSFANQNNKQQNEHCLRNFDLTEYRQVLSDLAVHIYQMMIKIMESKLQPMIVPGMLEHEAIPGVSGGARPTGMRQRTQSISDEMGGRYTLNSILKQLSVFHSIMTTHGMDPELVKQTFRQTFYIIGAGTLNNLLLRKEMCHWSKGMQIRYNVSQLEEWCRDHHLSDSGAIQSLEPVIQAAQLLQVNKKTEEDAKAICDTCKKLSSQQIIKILNLYTPVNEFEERVSISFIRIIQARLKERKDIQSTLLLDTKFSYPVTFPFNPSSLQLDSIQLPEALNVTFLRKV
ncbi:MYO5A [Branchiostoma lanceolatum]|uniref:MYO5A protein n=1 Tax=Branchiostoma lanceolatum TaxID=7740 RepID=A0A8J9ZCU3_BRALA|nr:MYO5A [Branchiostoma lanceolatum]